MDVCHLIVSMWVTAQGCLAPTNCDVTADGKHKFCTGGFPIACKAPAPYWSCERPNGQRYSLTQEEADKLRGDDAGR